MNLPDAPLLSMLRDRMTWLHQRQNVLSQNVANADTPGYVARDIKAMEFDRLVATSVPQPSMSLTNSRHIAPSPAASSAAAEFSAPDRESSPDGNAVSLEMQMIKVSDTQAQFAAAANLYAKAMNMMRTAIGR